ncbi:NADH-quinone oxidoreductase subunit C [Thermofilum adornatum]|uniref:NADH-quinone oxidoreductase subunit C n=1 Tax=Thermofilum adornatum TaxID=1365176 RepID=UPI0006998C28|nr:NADH-quinone oxidoreductase subunit C [Thermofilum adornatum]
MKNESLSILQELLDNKLIEKYEKLRERRWLLYTQSSQIRELATYFKSRGLHLSAITCEETFNEFRFIYHYDYGGELLNIIFSVPKAVGLVETITDIYPVADFYEREISEMFNVKIINAPRSGKLFSPDESTNTPHRQGEHS